MINRGQPNWWVRPRYIRQFFPLDAVLEGLFHLLGELFDVEVPNFSLPRWFRVGVFMVFHMNGGWDCV